jgi:TPR repeat protein
MCFKACQYFVGYFYANAVAVGRNHKEAFGWYKKSAEQNNSSVFLLFL